MAGFSVYGGGGTASTPGLNTPPPSQAPPLPDPWQTLGRMNNPGMAAYQAPARPSPIGDAWNGGSPEGQFVRFGQPQQPPMASQGMPGGITRRGSQMIDAQGNVIGHYDDNNQPVYYNRGGQALPPQAQGQPPLASTSMGMAPSYARMGVPGSMQQSLYGNGLLRPAMPSMNNQSGY